MNNPPKLVMVLFDVSALLDIAEKIKKLRGGDKKKTRKRRKKKNHQHHNYTNSNKVIS